MQITNAEYYLTCKSNESASYLEYIDARSYTNKDGEVLATIQIKQDETSLLEKMRNSRTDSNEDTNNSEEIDKEEDK